MLISEVTFPHLRAADEARLTQRLERRRIALERRAEARSGRAWGESSERMSRPSAGAKGPAVARPA
ncbi:hypothetical protein LQ757_03425 [Agromyces sp. SYSU K20354]|uniref:hypothetical protein n=1 Tax=Agromyces cavernae TaxID=2898659 RepID=UPI001E50F308|nr:hypothetical protein [Agromyces cavernae]MCD2441323.1 hypothetical protein [Agromyces cavernae]